MSEIPLWIKQEECQIDEVKTEPEDPIMGGETIISEKLKEEINVAQTNFNVSSEFQTELQNNDQQLNYINYICVSHVLTVDNSLQNTQNKEAKHYICNYCNKNFPRLNLPQIHQSSKDCPQWSFQMDNLDNSSTNNKEPMQRIQMHKSASECIRENQVLWKNHHLCHICGVIAKNLLSHLRNHEKLHKCTLCNFSCSWHSQLKNHMRVHTGKKPYKCNLCGKRFKKQHSVKLHMQTVHLKTSRFTCERCNRAFQSNRSLIMHKCL